MPKPALASFLLPKLTYQAAIILAESAHLRTNSERILSRNIHVMALRLCSRTWIAKTVAFSSARARNGGP